MGYRNRTIRKDFTDLGDDIWVSIRNPKLLPLEALTPEESPEGKGLRETIAAMNPVLANVISSWNVPDPGDDRDDAPSMELSPENVAKAPVEISTWVQDQVTEALTGRTAEPQDHLEAANPN